jgi:mRNA interferase RelE/StbE
MIPYEFSAHADRQMRRLPADVQRQIIKKLDFFLSTPQPLRFADALVGREGKVYRFRITDYRVIFELNQGKIFITAVGPRDRIY